MVAKKEVNDEDKSQKGYRCFGGDLSHDIKPVRLRPWRSAKGDPGANGDLHVGRGVRGVKDGNANEGADGDDDPHEGAHGDNDAHEGADRGGDARLL